jgi:K+-transporting ATPase A subunit
MPDVLLIAILVAFFALGGLIYFPMLILGPVGERITG